MFDWIKQNIGSIAVLLVVITIIALIVVFRKKANQESPDGDSEE